MQGAVFMPHNPQQGFSPSTALTATDMEASPSPSQTTKEALTNHSADSGIFSATNNTTMNPAPSCETDSRSDCSSPERKYFCPICDKTMTSQHEFTLHIRSHNNQAGEAQDAEKGYTCRICSKVLCSSSSLDRHVLVHSGERPFHCKYCGDTFTTNGNMHRHMRTHSGKAESYDESDGGSTDSGSSKSTEYNNNKVERRDKRKTETTTETITKRQKTDNPTDESFNAFQCPVCERNDFDSATILETHLEDNHPDHPAKCNQCKLVFLNNKLLTTHRSATHETPGQRQPVLGFRDLTFVDFSSEKFPHIARMECEANLHKVSGGLRFQCGRCGRAFPCVNSLEIHEGCCVPRDKVRDADIDPGITRGDIRRMEFFSRLNLVDNSPEKPSSLPNKLREHLVKAMDNTKDLADIQSILSNINLQQLHSNSKQEEPPAPKPIEPEPQKSDVHEEESQDVFAVEFRKMKLRGEFPCRLCTAVFPNLRALKGHNRAHLNGTNNGTYHCNMCPHSSLDKAALIRHMRTHNGDRPYECSLCNYAFTTKANCERHLRNRHSKTTREDVKKSIIYHPSEDPTNEDLNKLAGKEEPKKHTGYSNRIFTSTPNKLPETEPSIIPDMQALKPAKMFSSINDIIRNENLRAMRKDHHVPISPLGFGVMTPQNLSTKIQVKSVEELGSRSFGNESEDECAEEEEDEEEEQEQPLDLVLDLSKKKKVEEVKRDDEEPQDLTKKNFVPNTPPVVVSTVDQLLGQQFLKSPPKIDPAALYATQLAFYRSGFAHLPNWPVGFPLNPLLFPAALSQNPHDIKERIQRFQLCGGSMISEHVPPPPPTYPRPPVSFAENYNKVDDLKPLTLHIDGGFGEKMQNQAQPPPQPPPPPPPKGNNDLMQSPNSVKMVIKNGVLMPKQKQRRYRTERPFTCEHCSARFTLRSNMERHIKQQHPQYWSQRQRSNIGTPGRKPQIMPIKPNYCDLSIPNYEPPKLTDYPDTKDFLNEKLKFAILAQQLKSNHHHHHHHHINRTPEEDEDCALVIDEKEEKLEVKEEEEYDEDEEDEEEKVAEDSHKPGKNEENQDLVPVSRLLDNASQQQFREFFKRDGEEHEVGLVSEEDEEGLVASGSTSEGNISGTDENRSESDTVQPAKKKSAYSLAPNRVSCPYCSRKFPWTSSLRRHILTHTGQKPFKCSHCPLLFTTKSNCDRHLLRKHGNAATTIANDAPNNPNFLMRNVPERPFKCSSCPSSTFSTYSNLKKHISCKHSGDDIKAQGYEAGSSEDEKVCTEPKIDWSSEAPKPPPPPPSEQCCATTNSDLPFKCHLCEGSFSERQDALDHIKDKHASEYELLMSKNALDHNATTPEENHQDDEDGEMRGKFPDYSNRKVICAFCMRRFWSAEDLRRHMRTHTGERPFSCDICRRRFTLKHSMLRHRKKHNVSFEFDAVNSDEDVGGGCRGKEQRKGASSNESDGGGESGGDLISNLLGLRDRSIIDKVLTASADDAAKLLGVRNGAKE